MLKRCFLLIGLVSLLAVPVYGAEADGPVPLPDTAPGEDVALTPAGIELDPLFLAKGGGKGQLAGFLIPRAGDSAATCEWFYIDCIEEEDDLCCGSESSCLAYCEEICNGPCGPAAN